MSRVRFAAAVLALSAALAGCSGGSSPTTHSLSTSAVAGPVVTTWWSNSAHQVGSPVGAGTATVKPSRPDYCGMLRQTLAAGTSVLPGAGAADPRLRAATEAFLAELEQVAPSQVSSSWKVLGGAIDALVQAHGSVASVHGIDPASVGRAVALVSADAKSSCGLTLGHSG